MSPTRKIQASAGRYDRAVLVNVVLYHWWRDADSGCGCGWAELGRSHPEHVADVYEESIRALDEAGTEEGR